MKAAATGLLLLAVALTAGACWDYQDLEERALVTSLALDAAGAGDRVRVVVEVANSLSLPAGSGDGSSGSAGSPKILVQAEGEGLIDALENVEERLGRRPLWRQLAVVVVSRRFSEEAGLKTVFDAILRDYKLNVSARLFFTEGEASAVLAHRPQFHPLVGITLGRSARLYFEERGRIASPKDVLTTESELQDGVVLLPLLRLEEGDLRAAGSAVVREGRQVAALDPLETEIATWLLGDASRITLRVPCPAGGHVMVRIPSPRRRVGVRLGEGGIPRFSITLMAGDSRIMELRRCLLDPNDPSQLGVLEKRTESLLEERVRALIDRSQVEMAADIFRLGRVLKREFPDFWRRIDWSDLYPRSRAGVRAEVQIRETGFLDGENPFP